MKNKSWIPAKAGMTAASRQHRFSDSETKTLDRRQEAEAITLIRDIRRAMHERFDEIEKRFSAIDAKFDEIAKGFEVRSGAYRLPRSRLTRIEGNEPQ